MLEDSEEVGRRDDLDTAIAPGRLAAERDERVLARMDGGEAALALLLGADERRRRQHLPHHVHDLAQDPLPRRLRQVL